MSKSWLRCSTNMSHSSKESGSNSSSRRSRALSLPLACCAWMRRSPPPARAPARFSSSWRRISGMASKPLSAAPQEGAGSGHNTNRRQVPARASRALRAGSATADLGAKRGADAGDHQAAEHRVGLGWRQLGLSRQEPGQHREERAHDELHGKLARHGAVLPGARQLVLHEVREDAPDFADRNGAAAPADESPVDLLVAAGMLEHREAEGEGLVPAALPPT